MARLLEAFSQLELAFPDRVWALGLVVLVGLAMIRGRTAGGTRRWLGVALRSFGVLAAAAAFTGLRLREETDQQHVVFLRDVSHSLGPSAQDAASQLQRDALLSLGPHRATFVDFAAEPGAPQDRPLDPTALAGDRTDLAAALSYAAALRSDDHVLRIVLLSDGRSDSSAALAAAHGAGAPIFAVPLAAFAEPERAVQSLRVPAQAAPGAPVRVQVTLVANREQAAVAECHQDGQRVARQDVRLGSQPTNVEFTLVMPASERSAVEVRLADASGRPAPEDRRAENNRRTAFVRAASPPRVWVVGSGPGAAAWGTHWQRAGFRAEVRSVDRLPTDGPAFDVDLVALHRVRPGELSAEQHAALDRFVRQGGGLIVMGGAETFAAESFRGAFERLLPIKAFEGVQERASRLAMVLVIDRSASMVEMEDRLGLAKVAAKQAVGVLSAQDQVGVMAFGSSTEWISEIVPCSNKPELLRRIDTLKPEGQTNMFPALEKAYLALELTPADRRHVILLSDGVPYPGDFQRLAAAMAAAGITVSTVSVGKGADQTLLKDVSTAARGKHHHCDNAADIPNILVRETTSARGSTGPASFRAATLRSLPGLAIDSAPRVASYAPTSPKPKSERAETLLITPEGDPLLAWWRLGAGVAAAITADLTESWKGWPGEREFWSTLGRHAVRPQQRTLEPRVRIEEGVVTLEADVFDRERRTVNDATLVARVTAAGESLDRPLVATGPGTYRATWPVRESPIDVQLRGERESQRLGDVPVTFSADYRREYELAATDEDLLRELGTRTGGQFSPQPAGLFVPDARRAERLRPLWRELLMVAVVALVLDTLVRRWPR